MKYFTISFRSVFFYILIIAVYKIMGKREIGELSIIDLIVSMFIAELVAISIENYKDSMLVTLIPIIILVSLQLITSKLSLNNKKIRDLLDGKPSVVIKEGKLNLNEMEKIRYNADDLLSQLRNDGVKTIEEVDYAVLETNGKLSIFKNGESDDKYPLAVILNGVIDKEVLKEINKSESWLLNELNRQKIDLNNIFYCFFQKNNLYIIEKDKIKWQYII